MTLTPIHCGKAMVAAFLISGMFSTTAGADESWGRFRGPNGSGAQSAQLPTTWNDSENVAWKTELPGKGASSPVVAGDRIFLTAYTGYGLTAEEPGDREKLMLHVVCLSLDDGRMLWQESLRPNKAEQEVTARVTEHGYASPTSCVDDDNVYSFFGPSGLVAFTQSGQFLWRTNLGTNTVGFGAAASPMLFEDLVIMNASIESGAIYGVDKQSGEIRWTTDGINKAWTTPTLVSLPDGSTELVVNQKGAILGLDPRTGERLWRCEAIQDYVVPCVLANGAMLYCSGGRQNKTFVVRAGGRGDVTETHLVWDVSLGANVTSPLLHDGYLYWSHDKSIALCLRAKDGEQMFRERLPTRARVYASIVTDGQHLFLTTRDKGVLVLKASPEYEEVSINVLGEEGEMFNATPAVVGDRLLLRSETTLYCVQAK